MPASLKSWQHSAISLTILVVLLTLVYVIVIAPVLSHHLAFQERMNELQFRYAKLKDNISRADSIRMEVEGLKQTQQDLTGFLAQKQPSLAAADLQRIITDMVIMHGGELVSTQMIERPDNQDTFPEVTINVVMRGGTETLQKVAYQIAYGQPALILDNLQIQAKVPGFDRPDLADTDIMDIQFDLSGFIYLPVEP